MSFTSDPIFLTNSLTHVVVLWSGRPKGPKGTHNRRGAIGLLRLLQTTVAPALIQQLGTTPRAQSKSFGAEAHQYAKASLAWGPARSVRHAEGERIRAKCTGASHV